MLQRGIGRWEFKMILGYIGFGLLLITYIILITKWSKYFIMADIIATAVLVLYSVLIKDIPFILVNGFILIFLIIKQIKGGIK